MGTTSIGPVITSSLTLNDLNKFDIKKYNNMQKVEDAHQDLQRRIEFKELLEKVNTLTVENNIELGLRLIHKHIPLEEGKIMIEEFCEFNNKPAFVTSADFANDNTYPASWLVGND